MGNVENGTNDSTANMCNMRGGDDRLQYTHDEEKTGRSTFPG